ncbi:MAG: flavin prenyltransferase UbiX [Mariprofundaceae bacterium]|nr:flavin prenyltransferase UbiX [Mariprofundaceae bacterium]
MTTQHHRPIIIAMTGASGAPYALRLIERLAKQQIQLHVLISDAARVVLDKESDFILTSNVDEMAQEIADFVGVDAKYLTCWGNKDWMSPVASGSADMQDMVVVPCSMGSLARIATGASSNLIERATDVMLKEHKNLVLVPRETPLSEIHLGHMLALSKMGVRMIPAMPGFYHQPESIADLVDFMVDRIMDHLGVDDGGAVRWGKS